MNIVSVGGRILALQYVVFKATATAEIVGRFVDAYGRPIPILEDQPDPDPHLVHYDVIITLGDDNDYAFRDALAGSYVGEVTWPNTAVGFIGTVTSGEVRVGRGSDGAPAGTGTLNAYVFPDYEPEIYGVGDALYLGAAVPINSASRGVVAGVDGSGITRKILTDSSGRIAIEGADTVNNVIVTEQRFAYAHGSASALVKTGVGFVHTVSFSAATAAVIDVYDNTAGSGTKIRTLRVAAGATVDLEINASFVNGLYVNLASGTGEFGVSYR